MSLSPATLVTRALCLLTFPTLLGACEGTNPGGPSFGNAEKRPEVSVDLAFGEPPLEGHLVLIPDLESSFRWSYRIESEGVDFEQGVLEEPLSIPYRFQEPGVHRIRIELFGSGDPIVEEIAVVVTDPDDVEILAHRPLVEIWPDVDARDPEGIVAGESGVFIADYWTGEVVWLDPLTLEVLDRIVLQRQVEGLAISPSGDRLLAVHKSGFGISIVDLEDFAGELAGPAGGHFIHVIDESRVLLSGGTPTVYNLEGREADFFVQANSRHSAVDTLRGIAAIDLLETIEIYDLRTLASIQSIPFPGFGGGDKQLAFDPRDGKLFAVMSSSGVDQRLLVIDPGSGRIQESIPMGRGFCGVCASNPTATFGSARWIAFERHGRAFVVDTDLDLPRYQFVPPGEGDGGPASVAARFDSDEFYVLGGYRPYQVYRLRINP